MLSFGGPTYKSKPNGLGSHQRPCSHTHTPKHPWYVLPPHTPHDPPQSLSLPLSLNPLHKYPPYPSLTSPPTPLSLTPLSLVFPSTQNQPQQKQKKKKRKRKDGHQKIKQTGSNRCAQANPEKVLKLGEETWI